MKIKETELAINIPLQLLFHVEDIHLVTGIARKWDLNLNIKTFKGKGGGGNNVEHFWIFKICLQTSDFFYSCYLTRLFETTTAVCKNYKLCIVQ